MSDNRAIGIFDSGLGGLTAVAAIHKLLPAENLIYLGDTARVPYGNRSPETIRKFAVQDLKFLLSCGVKTILAACNTVSAQALDVIREYGVPVSGVIHPGVHAALSFGRKKITVLGTRGTIRSGAYEKELLNCNPALQVKSIACPLFVPLAEEGLLSGPVVKSIFDLYLREELANPPDVLLLGCTHYPLFKESLTAYFGGMVPVIDSAGCAAEFMKDFLVKNELQTDRTDSGSARYFVTDFPSDFDIQARRFLGESAASAEKVDLLQYERTFS